MKVYTVHEQPGAAASRIDRIDRAEHLQFLSDGFNWQAALFGPFELLIHKLYAGLAAYLLAIGAILALLSAIGAQPGVIALAAIAVHVIVGFEFGELKRKECDRNGWNDLGLVSGRSRIDCERRFFDRWLPRQPLIAGMSPMEAAPVVQAGAASATKPAAPGWRDWLSRSR